MTVKRKAEDGEAGVAKKGSFDGIFNGGCPHSKAAFSQITRTAPLLSGFLSAQYGDRTRNFRPGLVDDIISYLPEELPAESKDYIRRMCVYTCYGGKMNRGMTVDATLSAVKQSKGASPGLTLLSPWFGDRACLFLPCLCRQCLAGC